jgi:hypothetical protein
MNSLRSVPIALTVFVALQSNLQSDELPDSVKHWFEISVGKWESTNTMNPGAVEVGENKLVADGRVLMESSDTVVSLHAWESDKGKLVSTIYASNGTCIRRVQDVDGNTISGPATGVDDEGTPFEGTFTLTISKDGNSSEAEYKGTYKGEEITITWKGKKRTD